jgi:hypothetical protein
MAIDMIDDALQAVGDPVGRGICIGLCSAFYLCGMLEPADWEKYQERILESATTDTTDRPMAGYSTAGDYSTCADYPVRTARPPAKTPSD